MIGAAIEVHKLLGPGLLESAYAACRCHRLTIRGLRFGKQKPVPLIDLFGSSRNIKWGLLITFHVPVLKDGVRRFIMQHEDQKVFLNAEYPEIAEKRAQANDAS
jgi:hypothetical protein